MATTPQGTTRITAAKARRRLKKIHLKRSANGGFVVTHHFHPEYGGTPTPETHAFGHHTHARAHLAQMMGLK